MGGILVVIKYRETSGGRHIQTYSTSQIAKLVGVHPNTVRFYEQMQLLPPIPRKENGYRLYTDFHAEQLRLIRMAFRSEILSGSLRKMTIEMVRLAAGREFDAAIAKALAYQDELSHQRQCAEEALVLVQELLNHKQYQDTAQHTCTRRETAAILGVSIDVLRDWERNGLIAVPRAANGRRVYRQKELRELKIIRTLRDAHYSMMAILRMTTQSGSGRAVDLKAAIDTPSPAEDIVTATDQFITSLSQAAENTKKVLAQLKSMQAHYATQKSPT